MVDDRSMATRLQISGSVQEADLEMYRQKLPLTPQARVNGSFELERSRRFSPKGLLVGKYIFIEDLEKNQWKADDPRSVFWRCPAIFSFSYGDSIILDYEVFNISTFLASESIQVLPNGQVPIGFMSNEEKLKKLSQLKTYAIEVVEQIQSKKYEDYFPAKWKLIGKSDFIGRNKNIQKTLTFKEFERLNGIDILTQFK